MNYQLIGQKWVSAPKVKVADPTLVEVYVNVTTGIVGDTYGFTKEDTVVMDFPITMSGLDMQSDTIIQATDFIADKYPNT